MKSDILKIEELLDFDRIARLVSVKTHELGADGLWKIRLVMRLILQFVDVAYECLTVARRIGTAPQAREWWE